MKSTIKMFPIVTVIESNNTQHNCLQNCYEVILYHIILYVYIYNKTKNIINGRF